MGETIGFLMACEVHVGQPGKPYHFIMWNSLIIACLMQIVVLVFHRNVGHNIVISPSIYLYNFKNFLTESLIYFAIWLLWPFCLMLQMSHRPSYGSRSNPSHFDVSILHAMGYWWRPPNAMFSERDFVWYRYSTWPSESLVSISANIRIS